MLGMGMEAGGNFILESGFDGVFTVCPTGWKDGLKMCFFSRGVSFFCFESIIFNPEYLERKTTIVENAIPSFNPSVLIHHQRLAKLNGRF